MNCKIYDTTLRDGLQEYGREISIADAVKFAHKLDEMGFAWLEAGFASAGPEQLNRIQTLVSLNLKKVTVTAFGRTRGKKETCEKAVDLNAILKSGVKSAALVGKVRLRDVISSLQTDKKTNLAMISESVKYMKEKGLEVVFDAEHYFDGLKDDQAYTLEAIKTAEKAGAEWIVLCDTNGASTPEYVKDGVLAASKVVPLEKLGFHGHNDRGRAVANTEAAYQAGARHLQGTVNGFGERCGNCDLTTLIPNLVFDHNEPVLTQRSLCKLFDLSKQTDMFVGAEPKTNRPWVGSRAGYTEAGMHTSGIMRDKFSYIHADLTKVGNEMTYGVSEQSGKSSLAIKAHELGYKLEKEEVDKLTKLHDEKIKEGYLFAGAEASFKLLVRDCLGKAPQNFMNIKGWHLNTYLSGDEVLTEATILASHKNKEAHVVCLGNGPVDALNSALKEVITKFYPKLMPYKLTDYNVKIVNPESGTAAKVRVLIESRNRKEKWTTIGVNENLVEASFTALLDSLKYAILEEKA